MRLALLFATILVSAGCATRPLQSDRLQAAAMAGPSAHTIEGVPFIRQEVGHCGPATLAMVMNWAGHKISADELAKQVYTPGMKGSLQLDLISAARRQGMIAIPIQGFDALLSDVRAGHPVIIFENLGLSWIPQWHYAVVFGYDLQKRTLVMHSGPDAGQVMDMHRFEKDWMLGDYWGLVVLPPGQLSASADELSHVKAAAALEQIGKGNEAYASYTKILERWPGSLGANIGAANIAFSRNDPKSAVKFLQRATQNHPGSAAAWHNLAIALAAANRKEEARQSARQALALATAAEKRAYEDSLREWL